MYKAVEIPTDLKTSIATLCFPRFSINTSSSLLQNSFLISQQFLYFILICANKTEKFSFLPFSTAAEAAIAALQRKREIKLRTLLVCWGKRERSNKLRRVERLLNAVRVACSLHWARDTNKVKCKADSYAGVTLGVECGGTTGGNVHVPPPPTEGCMQGGLLC